MTSRRKDSMNDATAERATTGINANVPDVATTLVTEGRASSWRRVVTIAQNTFREAVRDRVLYNLVLFALMLTGAAIFLGELSAAQEAKMIVDLGLSAMLLFGAFIAVFVGVGLVYKEIERRTIYTILAKPAGRGEFLLGKYAGLCLTLAVNTLIMGAGVTLALAYASQGYHPLIKSVWPAIALIYLELTILVAVALLFSSFSTPTLSALMSLAVFVIGNFSADLKVFASAFTSQTARAVFVALYYLLPNLSNYAFITPAAHGRVPSAEMFLSALLYATAYIGVLLAASILIFSRRNFK